MPQSLKSGQLKAAKPLISVMSAKGARVFVFGMVSIMIPIYLTALGASSLQVGITLAFVIAGNILSNMLLTWYGNVLGRRRALLIFSLLMGASGLLFFSSTNYLIILIACFIGNISTTGTEAGPFQSIETGIIPSLAEPRKIKRTFGYYNTIGYAASSVGALAAGTPYYFHSSISAFQDLFLIYALAGVLMFAIYAKIGNIELAVAKRPGIAEISQKGRGTILKLSSLNAVDALGGGLVSQSILAYWFFIVYKVNLGNLGLIFLAVNVITALSTLGASFLAERLGNLRTMVYSHIISNVFLIAIPLAGSLIGSLAFLFLRQSMSQMDVPTRQAMMAELMEEKERVSANALVNTSRSAASIFGAPVSGYLIGAALSSVPLLASGAIKIAYDIATFLSFRKEVR